MKRYFILLLSLLFISGCSQTKVAKHQSAKASYMCITFTRPTKKENVFMSDIYCYSFNSKKKKRVATLPYKSSYPVSYYDRQANIIYYSKKVAGAEQLFAFNIKTKKEKQLTKKLFGISSIVKIRNNRLALTAADDQAHGLQSYVYDIQSGKIKKIFSSKFYTYRQYYDYDHNMLYVGGCTYKEWNKNDRLINDLNRKYIEKRKNDFYQVNMSTYKKKKIFSDRTLGASLNNVAYDDGHIYVSSERDHRLAADNITTTMYYSIYNMKTKKLVKKKLNDNEFGTFIGVYKHTLYYIPGSAETVIVARNLKTNKTKSMLGTMDDGAYNNGYICY